MAKKRYKKFVIGIDDKGKRIEFTCDENKLSNYFGANPEAPHFLTPIFFKKDVLDKYYNKPSEYSICDGYLFYTNGEINIWGMPIDNNQKDKIMVYLGDLGKLPYEEQEYWRLHNLEIEKGKPSATSFKRDFQAEGCSPEEPVLYFKERLSIFNNKWKDKFGWNLFKPLNLEDEHHLKSLKIPTNEQKEFDEKILSLTKILIDSLEISEMKKSLIFNEDDKSISIFEKFLEQKLKFRSPELIDYLKGLQELRSKCSAHRKSSDYGKFYKKFDKGAFPKTFESVIIGAITLLNTLENNILKEKINEEFHK